MSIRSRRKVPSVRELVLLYAAYCIYLHPAAQGQVNQVLELSINMEAQNAEDGVKSLAREFRRSVFFQVENIAVETTNPVRGVVSLQTALERCHG